MSETSLWQQLPRPVEPEVPEVEELIGIPDKPHTWGERWDGDHHQGRICVDCEEYSDCDMCNSHAYDEVDCLRIQADDRNSVARHTYAKEMERWEAQMDYWREITGNHGGGDE